MNPYYCDTDTTLYNTDTLQLLPYLDDSSVDLIVTDPPYFRVKGEWWDRQWDSSEGFLAWMDQLLEHSWRILKPNGSLYLFASPRMAGRVEYVISKRFAVLNHIIWDKGRNVGKHKGADKSTLRSFFPRTERILFAEHYHSDGNAKGQAGYIPLCNALRTRLFDPIRQYLRGEFERAGIGLSRADIYCGTTSMASRHYFNRSQWSLPTADHYVRLQSGLKREGRRPILPLETFHSVDSYGRTNQVSPDTYLAISYDTLKRDYDRLQKVFEQRKERLKKHRRYFSVTPTIPYTDVWDEFPPVRWYTGKHPCEKPAALLEHIIRSSSREDAVVADFFMGSGSTLRAARKLGRKFVGCEISEYWCRQAKSEQNKTLPALRRA